MVSQPKPKSRHNQNSVELAETFFPLGRGCLNATIESDTLSSSPIHSPSSPLPTIASAVAATSPFPFSIISILFAFSLALSLFPLSATSFNTSTAPATFADALNLNTLTPLLSANSTATQCSLIASPPEFSSVSVSLFLTPNPSENLHHHLSLSSKGNKTLNLKISFHLQMAESDAAPALSPPSISPLSSKRENAMPISSQITDLNGSRSELLTRIQGLKQDLQNWRSKLDTQVKIYHSELSEVKKMLNVEVEQLKSEFQELSNTLQQQHEDVTTGLNNLGIQDASEEAKGTQNPPVTQNREVQTPTFQDSKEV